VGQESRKVLPDLHTYEIMNAATGCNVAAVLLGGFIIVDMKIMRVSACFPILARSNALPVAVLL